MCWSSEACGYKLAGIHQKIKCETESMRPAFNPAGNIIRPTKSTQFYLFNLFGDYILPHGGRIWTSNLLYLLQLLDVSERAARTTLSRMKQRGWFKTHKEGRETCYTISESGRTILLQGDERIFEQPFSNWDGYWHLVVYSLPEKQRKQRHELRKKLLWFGFGRLAPGTWISPHNREVELLAVQHDLNITEHVTTFMAQTADNQAIIDQCWDIPALQAQYTTFLQRFQPTYKQLRCEWMQNGRVQLTAEACFTRRFWLTYEFQRFPLHDPNLPMELLPGDWVGFRARQLFFDYRKLLAEGMGDFIERLVSSNATRSSR